MKKLIGTFLMVTMLTTAVTAPTIFANETTTNDFNHKAEAFLALNEEISPALRVDVRVPLNTNWIRIATQNNIGPADIRVTNDFNNRGNIQARVVNDSSNAIIIPATTVPRGSTVTIGRVQAFDGRYRLEVRSSTAGPDAIYRIQATDWPIF